MCFLFWCVFFDCKCKRLNRLGENIQTQHNQKTDIHYFPAGTWDIFIIGRVEGWISCIYVFLCFCLEAFLLYLCSFCDVFVCMFSPSLFQLLHLQSTKTHNNRNNIRSFEKKTQNKLTTHKYIISQPEPDQYLCSVGSRAGYPVFLCLYKCCSRGKLK